MTQLLTVSLQALHLVADFFFGMSKTECLLREQACKAEYLMVMGR